MTQLAVDAFFLCNHAFVHYCPLTDKWVSLFHLYCWLSSARPRARLMFCFMDNLNRWHRRVLSTFVTAAKIFSPFSNIRLVGQSLGVFSTQVTIPTENFGDRLPKQHGKKIKRNHRPFCRSARSRSGSVAASVRPLRQPRASKKSAYYKRRNK